MKNRVFLTRQDLIDLCHTMNIQKGDSICLQCSNAFVLHSIGKAQGVLSALMEVLGPQGTLFMPTFSLTTLDPACLEHVFEYEEQKEIRRNQMAYDPSLTPCEYLVQDQFLKNKGVIRTSHPVYSFAYWGKVEEKTLLQRMNYPVSFSHVLQPFAKENARCLLLDIDPSQAVLHEAIAKTMKFGLTKIERGCIKKGSSQTLRAFLKTSVDEKSIEEAMAYCQVEKYNLKGFSVYCLSLGDQA